MLPIQRRVINYNKYPNSNKIEYIVIHDTGNSSPTADALAHYKYFSGDNRGSSAHYFIDTDNIIQIIDDKDGSWAVGDGNNKYGINNKNTISIEMCINDMKNIEKVIDHTVDLTVYLMKKYNISIDKVVRHFDASKKLCPNIMSKNNWAKWWEFKTLVQIQFQGGSKGMTKEEVVNIVNEIITPSLKGEGQNSDHWAYKDLEEINQFLYENKVEGINSSNLNDRATRGEMIAIVNRIRKGMLNSTK